ncbi:MAG: helix-turn-helix transcriptional regulator [Egibacteraceae bacterium]
MGANLGAEEVVPLEQPTLAQGLSSTVVGDVTSTLPAALSSFVGREREIAAVAKLLGSARLVTLTGAAGVGKTRLAMEVALSMAGGYANGAWLVELAPVADPDLVPAAVTAALGVREQRGRSLTETLASHLRDRRLLLMLDNCEHLIGAAAALAEALLYASPDLCILATSREALGLAGEASWPVPSLLVPPVGDTFLSLDAYEAVRLFVERAVATAPSFSLTPAVGPSVAEICRRLDGIPLAIELAASRVAVLTPAQIAARLDDRFTLLTRGNRTALPRQQTLLAAMEWSHDLLGDPERMLLRRLSVFAGGCTLEAVEQVCAGGGLEPRQLLDLLAGLVAKSLVVADTSEAQARYRLLESIRQYGAAKLAESGEEQALRERHAAWCMGLVEQAEPELTGVQQVAWLERLEAEHANLRAALAWGLTHQPGQGLQLAGGLALFWWVRGHLSEGRGWLEQALAGSAEAPRELRAKALWGAGWLAGWAGDFAAADAAGKESLALARQVGDIRGAARALHLLGVWVGLQDPVAGCPLLEESVALARQAGDRWCLAGALGLWGFGECFQSAFAAARQLLEECLTVARDAHDKQGLRIGLIGLGYVALEEGAHESAEASLREGLVVARELDDPVWTGLALLFLGELGRARGEHSRARALVEEGLNLIRASEFRWAVATAHVYLGRIAQAEGDLDGASGALREALLFARTTGNKRMAGLALLGMGEVSQILGDPVAARARFDEALAFARDCGAKHLVAESLYRLGSLAQSQGDPERAEALHHEALRLGSEIERSPSVAASLEALAGLTAEQGRGERAARLFGVAQSLRDAHACPRPPAEQPNYDRAIALVREGLSPEEFTEAWDQGASLTAAEAVTYASKGRGPRQRPSTGWASLTEAERNVVRLVTEGLTNREIGERLFISWRTVQAHLSHVFAKLGVTSRRQLAREAYRQGME